MSTIESPHVHGELIAELGLDDSFRPPEPRDLAETGLSEPAIESLILKYLLGKGSESGHRICDSLCLPFGILEPTLGRLRMRQHLAHAGSAAMNDYFYSLTETGRDRAQSEMQACAYVGPAPVPLSNYVLSVEAQSLRGEAPNRARLEEAFEGISVEARMFGKLGPAINSGKGMFLYGPPGNGKTTLARRITACYGNTILIPNAIVEDGQIIQLYDASWHETVEESGKSMLLTRDVDRRWTRIRRPTVVVGGELTMDSLELSHDPVSKFSQASLQMKSNCGSLLIDDFGRQRIDPIDLLNRWIVPLESHIDYLTLAIGKKIEVPFEQLIIFSTNLNPQDLTDEAFLRRIPYKIKVGDPTAEEFHYLFQNVAKACDCEYRRKAVNYLVETHYRRAGRPLRRCHARDLMDHIESHCLYNELQFEMNNDYFDLAVEVYFTVVSDE